MSLALQSFMRTMPKMWLGASASDTGWPRLEPAPTKKACADNYQLLIIAVIKMYTVQVASV